MVRLIVITSDVISHVHFEGADRLVSDSDDFIRALSEVGKFHSVARFVTAGDTALPPQCQE
jgi:hypothetical protein